MARWVKSKQNVRVFKTSTAPTTGDAPALGDLWIDTTTVPAILKVCSDATTPAFTVSGFEGLSVKQECRVASTAALTVTYANGTLGVGATLTNAGAQAALSIDSVSLTTADRVLVKNQVSTFQNGLYTVTTVGTGSTNWVMTRALDYDTAGEIAAGDLIIVNAGTVNTLTSWIETGTPAVMGTDAVTFSQFTISAVNATGTGVLVRATSPTLVTPLLGTVTSGNISACTSTSMAMVTPVLGTPTSGTLTNCSTTQTTVQQFVTGTAATYTTPANCKRILVECVGGGGGGGGSATTAGQSGAGEGGGSGGFTRKLIISPAATYTYSVGAAGAASAASNSAGGDGGTTTFSGSSLSAAGGVGGSGSGTAAALAISGGTSAGGAASGGDINASGSEGGIGFIVSGTSGFSGAGGASVYGGGGASKVNGAGSAGAAGVSPGSGGSGGLVQNGSSAAAGGAGAAGMITVYEFYI